MMVIEASLYLLLAALLQLYPTGDFLSEKVASSRTLARSTTAASSVDRSSKTPQGRGNGSSQNSAPPVSKEINAFVLTSIPAPNAKATLGSWQSIAAKENLSTIAIAVHSTHSHFSGRT